MQTDLITALVFYRLTIGYLGEREQFGWWHSSFFTQGSSAFLSPVFTRTQLLAQCNGVTRAAALLHDERIGVGHVYHLFRLPEEMEQGIHQVLQQSQSAEEIQKIISSKKYALSYLEKNSITSDHTNTGPKRVGDINAMRDEQVWLVVAGLYLYSFKTQKEILPYFTG